MLRNQVEQLLPNAAEDIEQSRGVLLPTAGPESAQGAWSGHATSADSVRALATQAVATGLAPDVQKQEAVHVQSISPGMSEAHDNVLFEGGWSELCNSGQDSQETIQKFQAQMENGLHSMQLELQKFKTDVLMQLQALQVANAGTSGTGAKSQKGSSRS